MATLIAVYSSERCVGRCDANCYNAVHARCACICGGVNHGLGVDLARANVLDGVGLKASDLKRFAAEHDHQCELVVIDRIAVPDARAAYTAAYMKLHQLELPLGEPVHG